MERVMDQSFKCKITRKGFGKSFIRHFPTLSACMTPKIAKASHQLLGKEAISHGNILCKL